MPRPAFPSRSFAAHSFAARSFAAAFFALACALTALPAAAEPPKERPLYDRVIRKATGENGYEELVLAAQSLRASKLWGEVEGQETTLETKRRVLADRNVVRALMWVRQGLAKPVFSPREVLTFETELPELAVFRSLGRLLAIQQYVFLADGRTADAIGSARLCLRLGQAVQTDTLISGLVGVAISTTCIRSLGAHLDQLSARDCAQLYEVCLEFLRQPSPVPRFLATERGSIQQAIRETTRSLKAGDFAAVKKLLGLDDERSRLAGAYLESLPPDGLDLLARQAEQQLNAQYDAVLEELRKPAWQRDRRRLEPEADGPATNWLVAALFPAMGRASDRFTQEEAQVRLLACHCAILRYRWEHEKPPASLEPLRLSALATDPFTGQPLLYEPSEYRYRLSSAGPSAEADDPRAVGGRRPVAIAPGE